MKKEKGKEKTKRRRKGKRERYLIELPSQVEEEISEGFELIEDQRRTLIILIL